MPAFPGCLYLIVVPLGDVIVVTPFGSAGSCLDDLRTDGQGTASTSANDTVAAANRLLSLMVGTGQKWEMRMY